MAHDVDYIVIGSGFGGSVAALRLAEKGYSVVVLEAGWRYNAGDFANSNWNARRFLWAPRLFCYGIQRIHVLKDVMILAGAGVGGGSLVYANTLLVPPEPFFRDPQWADLNENWQRTLAPFYDTAKRMLGVTTNPKLWRADEALRKYGDEIGTSDTFKSQQVGVFFGEPGVEVEDPYFNGEGPRRVGCTHNGHCIVGCNNGGKNSLDRNYLYLAEKKGVSIIADTTVTDVIPIDGGGYRVVARRSSGFLVHPISVRTATGVVFSAGALNTNKLLMRCRDRGHLPNLSPCLGKKVRTNSEVLNGVMARKKDYDFSKGIAITSSLFVDEVTHVEPVRYPAGSDVMAFLGTCMVDGGGLLPRWLRWLMTCVLHPLQTLRRFWVFGWAKRTVICLVMQTLDNHLELSLKRRWYWPFTKLLSSDTTSGKMPTYIAAGNAAARGIAKHLDAVPHNAITEMAGIPITAHILGGCAIGADAEHGVIDVHNKVFGYDDMYVTDGAQMPANLGVNPSLTITAMAEHAMSHIPPKTASG